jgi:serine/threonine protein kinase
LNYSKEQILGRGSFGTVYYGTYYKLPVAIKKLKNVSHSDDIVEDFMKEVRILM